MTKALSEARDAWKKEEEDTKLREIEHEVEVAVTNAVAEAKQMWDRTNIVSHISYGQSYCIIHR